MGDTGGAGSGPGGDGGTGPGRQVNTCLQIGDIGTTVLTLAILALAVIAVWVG